MTSQDDYPNLVDQVRAAAEADAAPVTRDSRMAAGYAVNEAARVAAEAVPATAEGNQLRALADADQDRARGAITATTATFRLRGAYADLAAHDETIRSTK